ncbi:MAG: leucine-rich repeat protein, partial [Alphaproteobacteria bacterium]|nr:leucine-rich repeat protein [Alphaproteobacteria bacterium]
CEVGKTCVPTDCSAYTLTSCPANATCTNCTVGCGDSTKKYKISKCNTGYTLSGTSCVCAPKDCSSYKITSSSACPANSKCSACTIGCGNNTTTYKVTGCSIGYMLKDGSCQPISNAIAFVLSVTSASGGITLYNGTKNSFTVDWGDGNIQNYTNTSAPTHTYSKVGEYQIIITGNSPYFYVSKLTNSYPTQILSVDLDSLLYLGDGLRTVFKDCSEVTGVIPSKLPSSIIEAPGLYMNCTQLTGNIPSLPSTLTSTSYMFYNCSSLTGNIPTLPSKLLYAIGMFYNCSSLTGSFPVLPTKIMSANDMFYNCDGLTGSVPSLPDSLTITASMFQSCNGLTGTIPPFPANLASANNMYLGCTGLTGKIPDLPSTLKGANYMFASTNVTEFPDNWGGTRDADYMFQNCTKLTGKVPNLPSTLETGRFMFNGCTGLTEGPDEWGGITVAYSMFKDCTGLRKLTSLPTNLQNANFMFDGCTNLQSPLPALPVTLTTIKCMFRGCSALTGVTPIKPNDMRWDYTSGAFAGTQLERDASWPTTNSIFDDYHC